MEADEVEVELVAAYTHVAADNGRTTLRPQRSKAGNRLHTILQAVREECEEAEETNPTRAHHADLNKTTAMMLSLVAVFVNGK